MNAKKLSIAILSSIFISQAEANKWSDVLNQAGGVLKQINDAAQQISNTQNNGKVLYPSRTNHSEVYDQGNITAITVNADNSAMNKGFFVDPLTNLMWSRCPVPMTWNGTNCVGEQVYGVPYYRIVLQEVKAMNAKSYAGYSDWRLPTMDEVLFMTYGTTQRGAVIKKSDVRGLDIWTNKLIRVGEIINGECTIGCMWGNPWTSNSVVTGAGQEFEYLDLSRADLIGNITYADETVKVGDGIDTATYENVRSAQSAVIRLVRGGNGPQDSGQSVVNQYRAEQNAHSAAFNAAYEKASVEANQCKKEKNAAWRKNIKVGDASNKGGVMAVNGSVITVNLKDGSFKNFHSSQLENTLENIFCMNKQYEVIHKFQK